MNLYEFLSLSVSLVAGVVSIVSLVWTHRLSAEQLKLARTTEELSKLQIKDFQEQQLLRKKPQLNVAITRMDNATYFIVTNTGQGSAFDVNFALMECADNPLSMSDVSRKLPYPELASNSRIKLLAAMHLNSPPTYQAKLTWREESGEECAKTVWVSR